MADPNAQFAVDIAAQMTGGEHTIAELDAIAARLTNAGADADALHDAMAGVTNQLTAARAATKAAHDALGEGQTRYAELEKAALQAAKAEERAALKGAIPPEVAATAARARGELSAYVQTLKQLEQGAKSAAGAETGLMKSFSNLKQVTGHMRGFGEGSDDASISAAKLKRALGDLGGPVGSLGGVVLDPIDGFQDLSEAMGAARAAAIVGAAAVAAMVAVVVALGVAAVAGAVSIAAWGVSLADASRSAGLATEAFEVLNPDVASLRGNFAALTDETGLAEAELNGIAKAVADAKVSAADLPDALRAAALAERALGKGGAGQFLAAMKASKKAAGEFSREMQDQLGGVVAHQMRGLDNQVILLRKDIGKIFGGLEIDPVLSAFETLRGLFDENSASGQTLKFLFETIFQPLIDAAPTAAYAIEALILGVEIAALKLYIALKPAIKGMKEFLGTDETGLEDTMATVTDVGEALFAAFAAGAVIVGTLAALLTGALVVGLVGAAMLMAPLVLAVTAVVAAFGGLIYAGVQVWNWLSSLSFGEIAQNLIAGLAGGILAGGPAVFEAISSVVSGAINAAKSLLGIHSPSTVFADIADDTVMGFTNEVDAQTPEVQSALTAMVEPPVARVSSPADSGGGSSASTSDNSRSLNIHGNTFNFYGVEDAEDAENRFGEMMTKWIEGKALQVGAPAT